MLLSKIKMLKSKIGTPKIILQFNILVFNSEMLLEDVDGMGNSVGPDQSAP